MIVQDRDIHFLNKAQASLLLDYCGKNIRQKTLILVMLDAGLRVSEAISLKLSDFDFRNRILNVVSLKKRGAVKTRQIPLSARLYNSLADYIKTLKDVSPSAWLFPSPAKPGEHISRFAVNRYLSRLQDKINVPNLHPHALRHSFATSLVTNGTELYEVSDLLGHENLDTTRIYTHIPQERLRKSVQAAASANGDKSDKWYNRLFHKKLPTVYIPPSNSGSLIIGRDDELQQITDFINKGTNVLLIGDTGVGKKTLLDSINTEKKILTLDDTSGIKKSLVYLLLYLYENDAERVANLMTKKFDRDAMQTKLSRQTVGNLCDEIIKITEPKQFILKIRTIESITSGAMRAIEALKDQFIIITTAKEIPINKASFLWNFEKIQIKNLSRPKAFELIHKLSYDMEIEDYDLYRNHILEQTDGNPRAIFEMVERYRREPVLLSETIRNVTHRGPIRDFDLSFVVILVIASLAIFRYLTSEFDNPGLRVIGGMSMIILLFGRSLFAKTKRKYV